MRLFGLIIGLLVWFKISICFVIESIKLFSYLSDSFNFVLFAFNEKKQGGNDGIKLPKVLITTSLL